MIPILEEVGREITRNQAHKDPPVHPHSFFNTVRYFSDRFPVSERLSTFSSRRLVGYREYRSDIFPCTLRQKLSVWELNTAKTHQKLQGWIKEWHWGEFWIRLHTEKCIIERYFCAVAHPIYQRLELEISSMPSETVDLVEL